MEGREEEIRLVVDTNILISALLRDDSFHARLIKSGYFELYYPDYGMTEIEKYSDYITSKRAKQGDQLALEYALKFILESVLVIPDELYSQRIREAFDVMKSVDEKDTPFLALAMQLNSPIWSNDNHFKEQHFVKVYTTSEIIDLSRRGSSD